MCLFVGYMMVGDVDGGGCGSLVALALMGFVEATAGKWKMGLL